MPTVDGIDYTQYGGYNVLGFEALNGVYAATSPAGSGPRLGKVGQRWVYIDPAGKVMWLRGIYRAKNSIDHTIGGTVVGGQNGRRYRTITRAKYKHPTGTGGDQVGDANWTTATGAKLRSWHFNFVGMHSDNFNLGGGMLGIWYQNSMTDAGSKAKQTAAFGGTPTEGIKSVLHACKSQAGWVGRWWGDVLDPKYAAFVNASYIVWPGVQAYFQGDDGDFTSAGMGSAHPNEVGGIGIPGQSGSMHQGIISLIANPTVTSQTNTLDSLGTQTWSVDTVLHAKAFLIAALKVKYGNSLAAFNTAWGSTYGSFDSMAGGWGVGNGLADEDGCRARPWFGVPTTGMASGQGFINLVDSTQWGNGASFGGVNGTLVTSSFGLGQVRAVKDDLDTQLFKVTEAYLKAYRDRIKGVRPNALFIGSTGAPGRIPGWWAQTMYCDLAQGGGHCAIGNSHVLVQPYATQWTDYIRTHMAPGTDIPLVIAQYTGSLLDSSTYYKVPGTAPLTPSQAGQGNNLKALIEACLAYQDPNGIRPYIGYIKWGLVDQPEEVGWGILSYNDNPYDGTDYRVAMQDPYRTLYGFSFQPAPAGSPATLMTLTEDFGPYGDQLTPITTANKAVLPTLQSQLGSGGLPDITPPTAPGAVTALQINAQSLHVQWGAATDPGSPSSGIAHYRVGIRETLIGGAYTVVGSPTGTNFLITGLTPAKSYDVQVHAVDNALPTGLVSATAAAATFVTLAGAPAGTEGFNGPDNPTSVAVDQSWTALGTPALGVSANRAAVTAFNVRGNARMEVDAATVEQFVQDTLTGLVAAADYADIGICLRHAAAANTKYALVAANSHTFGSSYKVVKVLAGVETLLATLPNGPNQGESRRLECRTVGATVELTAFKAGVQNGPVVVDAAADRITTGLRSGLTGFAVASGDGASCDTFAFGSLTDDPDPEEPAAPIVAITTPADLATVAGTIAVTATITDPGDNAIVSSRLYLDAVEVVGSEQGIGNYLLDTLPLTNASHTLRIEATNNLGLIGTSALITVTVNNPAPVTTRRAQFSWAELEVPDQPGPTAGSVAATITWDRDAAATAYQVTHDLVIATVPQVAVGLKPFYIATTVGVAPTVQYEIRSFVGNVLSEPLVVRYRHIRKAPTGFQVESEVFTA